MKVVVSTDSLEYASILKHPDVQTIHRPREIAQDNSTDIEFIQHAIKYLKDNENYEADIILQLRPTPKPILSVLSPHHSPPHLHT